MDRILGHGRERFHRDYAHVYAAHFPGAHHTQAHLADFERAYRTFDLGSVDRHLTPHPDVVVIQLGDNVRDTADFTPHYQPLVARVAANTGHAVLCVSTWVNAPATNAAIRAGCVGPRTRYIDISVLWDDVSNRVRSERDFTNEAVAGVHGDRGMSRIADVLYAATSP